MRQITQYSQHIYTTKGSAMRAARSAVGSYRIVDGRAVPELQNRFDGDITITSDMISVEAYAGGWRWSYTFDVADVMVGVLRADGTSGQERYADVAHWANACTPVDKDVAALAEGACSYLLARNAAGRDDDLRELYDLHMPHLLTESARLGVDLGDLFSLGRNVGFALASDNPGFIAEVLVQAERFGLRVGQLRVYLARMARKRGCHYDRYLHVARQAA